MSEDRLVNIENKVTRIEGEVDKMADAIVILARLEERIVTVFKGVDGLREDVKDVSSRVLVLEQGSVRTGVWGGIGDKVLYIVLGVAITWASSHIGVTP